MPPKTRTPSASEFAGTRRRNRTWRCVKFDVLMKIVTAEERRFYALSLTHATPLSTYRSHLVPLSAKQTTRDFALARCPKSESLRRAAPPPTPHTGRVRGAATQWYCRDPPANRPALARPAAAIAMPRPRALASSPPPLKPTPSVSQPGCHPRPLTRPLRPSVCCSLTHRRIWLHTTHRLVGMRERWRMMTQGPSMPPGGPRPS